MIKIYIDSVRHSAPDSDGARLTIIGEQSNLVFSGTGEECADYLQSVPVGLSVCVRHKGGLRSCMNKPALWEVCRGYI